MAKTYFHHMENDYIDNPTEIPLFIIQGAAKRNDDSPERGKRWASTLWRA